jgi:hypothetical protein
VTELVRDEVRRAAVRSVELRLHEAVGALGPELSTRARAQRLADAGAADVRGQAERGAVEVAPGEEHGQVTVDRALVARPLGDELAEQRGGVEGRVGIGLGGAHEDRRDGVRDADLGLVLEVHGVDDGLDAVLRRGHAPVEVEVLHVGIAGEIRHAGPVGAVQHARLLIGEAQLRRLLLDPPLLGHAAGARARDDGVVGVEHVQVVQTGQDAGDRLQPAAAAVGEMDRRVQSVVEAGCGHHAAGHVAHGAAQGAGGARIDRHDRPVVALLEETEPRGPHRVRGEVDHALHAVDRDRDRAGMPGPRIDIDRHEIALAEAEESVDDDGQRRAVGGRQGSCRLYGGKERDDPADGEQRRGDHSPPRSRMIVLRQHDLPPLSCLETRAHPDVHCQHTPRIGHLPPQSTAFEGR